MSRQREPGPAVIRGCFYPSSLTPCKVVCGKCRGEKHRISEAHKDATDEEFEALIRDTEDSGEPLTRKAIRAIALRKHNAAPKAAEWPVLSVRLPPGLLGLLDSVVADSGMSRAAVGQEVLEQALLGRDV